MSKGLEDFYGNVEVKYSTITKDGIKYYILKQHMEHVFREYVYYNSSTILKQHSQFAINTKTNEIIKCRRLLEDIIDSYCGIK